MNSSVFFFVLSFFFAVVTAHSNLGKPLAYSNVACKASASWCKGSCPPIWPAKQRNSPQKPAAVWKRGQKVEIIYHKNNHVGGFYRRSLVPVKYMFEESWHKKTAFDYGCWQQGTFQCGKNDVCGADLRGRAYKNYIIIPAVFPDGDYVFAHVWFGGLYWKGTYSKYSDYFACSFVRIQGGTAMKAKHEATFTGPDKTCRTGKTFPLDCGGDGCNLKNGQPRPAFTAVPKDWQNGKQPSVSSATLGGKVMKHKQVQTSSAASSKKAVQDATKDTKNDKKMAKEMSRGKKSDVAPKQKREASVSETNDNYKGPIQKLYVMVANENAYTLKHNDYVTIETAGKPVYFQAYTGNRNIGELHFKVPGKPYITQGRLQYNFRGSWTYGKNIPIRIMHLKGGRTDFKVTVKLV